MATRMRGSVTGAATVAAPGKTWSVMALHTIITFVLMLTAGLVVFFLTEYMGVLNREQPSFPWNTASPQSTPQGGSVGGGAITGSVGQTNDTKPQAGTIIARAIGIGALVSLVLVGIEKLIVARFARFPRVTAVINYYGPLYTVVFVMTLTLFSLSFRLYSLSHMFSGHVMLGFAFGSVFGGIAMIYLDHKSLFFVNTAEELTKEVLKEGGATESMADRLMGKHLDTMLRFFSEQREEVMGDIDRQRHETLGVIMEKAQQAHWPRGLGGSKLFREQKRGGRGNR